MTFLHSFAELNPAQMRQRHTRTGGLMGESANPSKTFELEANTLVLGGLRVQFQRTFRVADATPLVTRRFGSPSVYNVDPQLQTLPADVLSRGGVLIPTYPWEAFHLHLDSDIPMAVQIGYRGRCALTGDGLSRHLSHRRRNYVVVPFERRVSGAVTTNRSILQFSVGHVSVSNQPHASTDGAEHITGLQLQVWNLTDAALQRWSAHSGLISQPTHSGQQGTLPRQRSMSSRDWQSVPVARVWIHLVDPALWPTMTGSLAPASPISSSDYFTHGLPWLPEFEAQTNALRHRFTFLNPSTAPRRSDDDETDDRPSSIRTDAARGRVPVYPGDWKWC